MSGDAAFALQADIDDVRHAVSVLLPVARTDIIDGRARFREIYCAVRDDHGGALPYDRPCQDSSALWRLPDESPPTGRPVRLGPSQAGLTVMLVPGLLAECVTDQSTLFADARAGLEAQGWRTGYIQTRGRQSSETNARVVRDALMALPANFRVVLVTHSKGTVDAMQALAGYPELAGRVVALVSVAGAVNGSPLADAIPQAMAEFVSGMPLSSCPPGQNVEAADSLRRSVRLAWLATHRLPPGIRTYSLAPYAGPDDISAILWPFYRTLAKTEPRNDGLVVVSDAVIPGSTLLGHPNADHLAVAMPFDAKTSLLSAALITHNPYPRAVLLEAALRFVEGTWRDPARRRNSDVHGRRRGSGQAPGPRRHHAGNRPGRARLRPVLGPRRRPQVAGRPTYLSGRCCSPAAPSSSSAACWRSAAALGGARRDHADARWPSPGAACCC